MMRKKKKIAKIPFIKLSKIDYNAPLGVSNLPPPNTKEVRVSLMGTTGVECVDEEGSKITMTTAVGELILPVEVFKRITPKELLKMWKAQQNR